MEFKLLEHCQLCVSSKKTERKRGMNGLKELLSEDSAIQLLNRNSSMDQVNWTELFKCAHRALLLESDSWKTDDSNKSASSTVVMNRENAKRLFSSLADVVLQKANALKPTIDCSEIIEACFRIFSDKYLMKICGDVYLTIMQNNVLPVRKYRNSLSSDDWDKLFQHVLSFIDLEKELRSGLYYQAIELMSSVITFCCHQSHLCLHVKSKLLPLLEMKFFTFHEQVSLQEVLLKLVLDTCTLVGKESRTGVCHLGELILPAVLKMFKAKGDDKTLSSQLVVDFLLFQVQCHHPNGAKQDSGAAYACDWKKWTRSMHVMYRTVLDTISRIERNRLGPLSDNFVHLSVELFYHLLDKTNQACEISITMNETEITDEGPAAKRRKWMTSTEELFEELRSCRRDASGWPILIMAILKKYPNLFQDSDLLQLMQIMSEMQSNWQNQETLKYVNMCCEQLVKVSSQRSLSSDILLKIWDTSLRSVSSIQSEIHPLLQTLVSERIAPISGLQSLLRMFQRHIFQLSDTSIRTLSVLLSHYPIPECSALLETEPWDIPITSARIILLDWIFSYGPECALEPKQTSKVLVKLILRGRYEPACFHTSASSSDKGLEGMTFQENYCVSAFEDGLLLPLNHDKLCPTSLENSKLSSCVIDLVSKDKLENLLRKKYIEIERKISELPEESTSVSVVKLKEQKALLTLETIGYSALVLNIMSNLLEFFVVTSETLRDTLLYEFFIKSMKDLSKLLPEVLKVDESCLGTHKQLINTLEVLQLLKRLYGSDVAPCLNNHLCELTDKSILLALVSFFYDLSNDQMNLDLLNDKTEILIFPENIFNCRCFTNRDNFRFLCIEVLTSFSCLKVVGELHAKQISVIQRIIKVLSESDTCDLTREPSFLMVYHILSALLSRTHLDQEKHLQPMIHLLKSVCRQWKNDAEASSNVMHLLRGVFKHASIDGRNWERKACLVLLAPFRNMSYGPKFTIQYLSCLYELFKVDKELKWARWEKPLNLGDVLESETIPPKALRKFHDSNNNTAVIEDVLFYLLSPFHEIRLVAVPIVSSLFCGEHQNPTWTETMFERLTLILYELYIVKGDDMPREEVIDEGANRTSTVLHILASMLATSSRCQLWSLRLMFSIMKKKNLDQDLIKKVFQSLANTINLATIHIFLEKSLPFIVNEWLQWGYQLQEFPYSLLNLSSFTDFCKKYQKSILPIILKSKNPSPLLNFLCQELDCSSSHLLKKSFPSVYAQYIAFLLKETSSMDSRDACKQYKSFLSSVDSENLRNLVSSQIDDILFEITSLVWDPSHHESLLGLDPAKVHSMIPFVSIEEYSEAFKHLQRTIMMDQDLLICLVDRQPDLIQKILLQLREEICSSITLNQRLKRLHNYSAFVHAIASRFGKGDFASCEEFLLSDITHTLLYVIQENKSNSVMMDVCIGSCCFLYILYHHILPTCASAFKDLLPTIIGCLIPLAMDSGILAENSLKLIKLLVITHSSCLGDAIGCLPPFPESSKFIEMRKVQSEKKYQEKTFSLKDEIDHFLSSSCTLNTLANQYSMFDGLHSLRKELCRNKTELLLLYQDLKQGRGSSQDCKKSVLHQLICKLIDIASSANEKVQMEAMRCLGELGPTDLTTLVLRPVEGCVNVMSGFTDPVLCVMALAAQILSENLLDHNIEVVKSTRKTLLNLMSCQKSNAFHSTKSNSKCLDSKKISPFIPKETLKPTPSLSSETNKLINLLADDEIWFPSSGVQHEKWIVRLASSLFCALSEDDVFKDFASLCDVKTSFAEEMFPVLFYLGLSYSPEVGGQLCTRLAQFFENHFNTVYLTESNRLSEQDGNSIYSSKSSVQCMLNVVNFVRLKQEEDRNNSIILKVNYLHVASAAQYCSAYLSSIMFLEFWCNGESRPLEFDSSGVPYVDFISEHEKYDGKVLQNLLIKAYEEIGDSDAMYGCGSSIILDPKVRITEYEHAGMWDKVLLNFDVKLSSSKDKNGVKGLISALHSSRLYHILNTYVESQPPEQQEEFLSAQLDCMWRLGQWNAPLPSDTKVKSFEWSQYSALQAVSDQNTARAHECVNEGRLFVLGNLAHSSLENCKNIYKPLTHLQILQEIEDFVDTEDVLELWNKWKNQDILPYNDIHLLEMIKAQRATLLQIALKQENNHSRNFLQPLSAHYLETAELARKEGQIQIAEQWLQSLSAIPNLCEEDSRNLRLQEAQLAWSSAKGLRDGTNLVARNLLRFLIKDVQAAERESGVRSKLHPQALILYGKWMAETRSENPQQIIEDYLEEALQLLKDLPPHSSVQEQLEAHSCLAHFADLEYQRITVYIKSETFQKKVKCMEVLRTESSLMVEKGNREQTSAVNFNRNYSALDENEIKNTYKDQDQYLELAMRHYLTSMRLGEGTNIPVFRMVSLWLENSNKTEVNKIVYSELDSIQTYKFIELLPQIAARLGSTQDTNTDEFFSKAMNKLLIRCCLEHPYHTLPLLLALANSYEDFEGKIKPEPEPRVTAAIQMVEDLQRNKSVGKLLTEMDKLSKALVNLAYIPVPDQNNPRGFSVPKDAKIRVMRNLQYAMLPIIHLPVQSDAKYNNIISIHSFDSKYLIAGGVNKPKKIVCVGSDGVKRLLLVKGRDDLRQDAVMQQVFSIVNTLLQACPETKRRRLKIRTYKIVPLSQRCGVLEWCQNTSPIQEVLLDAHSRYYPSDYKITVCYKKIDKARLLSVAERLHVFKEVCQNVHPAFRFFFTEKYPTPAEWFEHRLNYVHSVATNSMVGYILGLGDRHANNILIDKSTGELIHIDFGIAFEQGKVLPTPETVPFRLTRDIVDGMGISGVEGVFRRSCEKTMSVLRENHEKILTILEVLLYDPLYQWTITPKMAAKRQKESSQESIASDSDDKVNTSQKNKMAVRALCRLKEKLQGTEEGPASSIEGQVNRLIQQARDLGNLSRLFKGWQAYL